MHAHGAAANLEAVQDEVKVLSADLQLAVSELADARECCALTLAKSPDSRRGRSSTMGAVNGWCELLHRPCAR